MPETETNELTDLQLKQHILRVVHRGGTPDPYNLDVRVSVAVSDLIEAGWLKLSGESHQPYSLGPALGAMPVRVELTQNDLDALSIMVDRELRGFCLSLRDGASAKSVARVAGRAVATQERLRAGRLSFEELLAHCPCAGEGPDA